jgi:hypothetical protein
MTEPTPVTNLLGDPPEGIADEPAEDTVSSNLDDIQTDDVYMSLTWLRVPKEEAIRIRDAALSAANRLSSYSVTFSAPMQE